MRILIVEDEMNLNNLLCKKFEKEGYGVDGCYDGSQVFDYLNCAEYDAIILDIMLPGMNGLEILDLLRKKDNKTPVLLLTARDSVQDRVRGLDLGADDYLVKPFSLDELLARIRVLIRRSHGDVSDVLTASDLVIDLKTRTVLRSEKVINLTSKEFAILEYLVRNKNIVLSREKISNHIWNYEYEGGSNVVDVYIRYLRKKIDDDFEVKLIHTIRGSGYVFGER